MAVTKKITAKVIRNLHWDGSDSGYLEFYVNTPDGRMSLLTTDAWKYEDEMVLVEYDPEGGWGYIP